MIGLDFLGLGSKYWNVEESLAVFPDGWALGCFDSTFGDVVPNLKKFLQSGKVSAVRVHLWWSDAHIIAPLSVIKQRAPVYERLALEFPSVKFYVSHSCEYNEKDKKAVQTRVNLVNQLARHCIVVNTPLPGSATVAGVTTERHGDKALGFAGDFVSTDGQNIYDINAENWVNRNRKADITFLWGMRFNLRENTHPGQKPPPPKERKAAPPKGYIKGIIRLAYPEGTPPPFEGKGTVTPLPEKSLYKSFAEDSQGSNDPRELKPVLIIPPHDSAAEILTCKGESIGKFIYFGEYQKLSRYYSGVKAGINLYGYQIAEKAKQKSGSEFVWFKCGSKIYGPVNPAFRAGYFHN